MKYQRYAFAGKGEYTQGQIDPGDTCGLRDKAAAKALLEKNRQKISALQDALYAEERRSLLVIFQAMDAAGKDGAINHVFSGINPQGMTVTSFKQPSGEELAHDYLWRVHAATPRRGEIGIFNRSHYEDVLVGKVLDLPKGQRLPAYVLESLWKNRYRQIRDFERALYENGVTILKFYLHLSRQEQSERFLARLTEADKNWKFSKGDLDTSERWQDYMEAYERAINETAAAHAPWYVIPADRKWVARTVISQIVLDTLREMDPRYPEPTGQQLEDMQACRSLLEKAVKSK